MSFFQMHFENDYTYQKINCLFDELFRVGADYELKAFGIRAMDSLRLEKSYRLIPREMSIEYSALESGLDVVKSSCQGTQ